MKNTAKYYKLLDISRLYCALLIIFIHMGLSETSAIVPCLARQGVPFFFLVSGFFFYKNFIKNKQTRQFTISYIKPIILVYFIWIIFWSPSTLMEYAHAYPNFLQLTLVLLRRFLLAGVAPYWYLLVLFEGILLLTFFIKYKKLVLGAILCVAGIILCIVYGFQAKQNTNGIVYIIFNTVFSWNCNVFMSGFPMLFLGAITAKYEERICRFSPRRVLIILYVLIVFAAFLIFRTSKDLFFIPFGIIQAIILFLICVSYAPLQISIQEKRCRDFRNLSSIVFLTHTVFLTILGKGLHIWDNLARYTITVACTVILFFIVNKLNWKALNTVFLIRKPN